MARLLAWNAAAVDRREVRSRRNDDLLSIARIIREACVR